MRSGIHGVGCLHELRLPSKHFVKFVVRSGKYAISD